MAHKILHSSENLEIKSNSGHQVDLPIEIVVYVMEFLPLADRISASQVCQTWYEASRDQKLHKNEIVILHENLTRPIDCLLRSSGTFINFIFKEVELNSKFAAFWDKFCPQIQYLGLLNCVLSEKMFVDILSKCHRLESLIINNSRELLMSGRILEIESDVLLLRKTLVNLKELSITHNRYMSDAIFYRFVSIAPNLQDLDLTGCQVSYHNGLYRKFYPTTLMDESSFVLSESVLTFNVVLKYIRENAKKLKVLRLGDTFIDNSALSQLAKIPDLNLSALHLQSCEQLTNPGLTDLVSHQKFLTYLDLSGCSRLTDHALIAICHNLSNLKALNIRNCRAVTNIGVTELFKLNKLECLNMAQCEMVTGEGIVKGLCVKVNHKFRKLNLCALLIDEESVCELAKNLLSLQLLDLSWCVNAVTDRSLQTICTNLCSLRTLKLGSCNKLSDFGITGILSTQDSAPDAEQFDDYGNFLDPLHTINLRTRAEREIVNDAKRKNVAFNKCITVTESQGNGLDRLKGLQYLDFSGCNRITDVSLVYSVKFVGLRHFDISRCQQVTQIGLSALAENNPSLEVLIMNECLNVTDEALQLVVKLLRRLKHLEVQGCKDLTDKSLHAIGIFCPCLQYLNVNNCVGMTINAALELQKTLLCLHTIHYVNLNNEATLSESVAHLAPPPPPPPPKKNIFRCFLR